MSRSDCVYSSQSFSFVCVHVCAYTDVFTTSQAQYTFIHDALEELITCGETAFNVQDMVTRVNRLNSVVAGKGVTGFKEQFDVCVPYVTMCRLFIHCSCCNKLVGSGLRGTVLMLSLNTMSLRTVTTHVSHVSVVVPTSTYITCSSHRQHQSGADESHSPTWFRLHQRLICGCESLFLFVQ